MGDIWLFLLLALLMNKTMEVAAVCLAEKHPEFTRVFILPVRAGGKHQEITASALRSCTHDKRHWLHPAWTSPGPGKGFWQGDQIYFLQ